MHETWFWNDFYRFLILNFQNNEGRFATPTLCVANFNSPEAYIFLGPKHFQPTHDRAPQPPFKLAAAGSGLLGAGA